MHYIDYCLVFLLQCFTCCDADLFFAYACAHLSVLDLTSYRCELSAIKLLSLICNPLSAKSLTIGSNAIFFFSDVILLCSTSNYISFLMTKILKSLHVMWYCAVHETKPNDYLVSPLCPNNGAALLRILNNLIVCAYSATLVSFLSSWPSLSKPARIFSYFLFLFFLFP